MAPKLPMPDFPVPEAELYKYPHLDFYPMLDKPGFYKWSVPSRSELGPGRTILDIDRDGNSIIGPVQPSTGYADQDPPMQAEDEGTTTPSKPKPKQTAETQTYNTPSKNARVKWTSDMRTTLHLIVENIEDSSPYTLRLNVFNQICKKDLTDCGFPQGINYQRMTSQHGTRLETEHESKVAAWVEPFRIIESDKGKELLQKIKDLAAGRQ